MISTKAILLATLLLGLWSNALADEPCSAERSAARARAKRAEEISLDLARRKMDEAEKAQLQGEMRAAKAEAARLEQVWRACMVEEKKAASERSRQQQEEARRQREEETSRRRAELAEKDRLAAEHRALVVQRMADREWMIPPLSAKICEWREGRAAALDEIATEKKYARIGGAVSLSKLHFMQEMMRSYDDKIAEANARLKKFKAKALPCRAAAVQGLRACVAGTPGACDDEKTNAMAELAHLVGRELGD